MLNIDYTYLDILADGDEDFIKEYLETFKINYTTLTAKMLDDLAASDFATLSKTAHQLKPTAKMIQLPCGEELEFLQHNPKEATKDKIEEIRTECEEALELLTKWAHGNQ
ncbi:MAG: hypothetical protein AAF616_04215 [Bacteroidota bacterium]